MRKYFGSLVIALAALTAMSTAANAALFVNETFNRADGVLVGNAPTPGPGAAWAAHSGAGANAVQNVGNAAVLNMGGGSREDVNTDLGATLASGQTFYAAYDLNVNAIGAIEGTVYFSHFQRGTSNFASRVFLVAAPDGRDWSIGISGSGSAADQTWSNGFNFPQTVRVIHSFNLDTREARLWVNPVDINSTSISSIGSFADAVHAYGLRQADMNNPDATVRIDNLCVASDFVEAYTCLPEPGTLSVLAMGSVVLLRRRK